MLLLESDLSARPLLKNYDFLDIYETSLKSIAKKRLKRIWQMLASVFTREKP